MYFFFYKIYNLLGALQPLYLSLPLTANRFEDWACGHTLYCLLIASGSLCNHFQDPIVQPPSPIYVR
jgi:hypothetical protein